MFDGTQGIVNRRAISMAGGVVETTNQSVARFDPRVRWAMVLGLLTFVFSPALLSHFRLQWSADHLSHFPLTLILVAYLFYEDLTGAPDFRPAIKWRAVVSGVLAIIAISLSAFTRSGWLGTVGYMLTGWAIVDYLGGVEGRNACRRGFVMMLALLHPPFGLDQMLIISLQKISSTIASSWLDVQGIANVVTGVVVRTPEKDFLVEEACSGVNSFYAAMTVGLFWVLFNRYRLLRSVLFLSVVFTWVLLMNALRVWAIVYAFVSRGSDLTTEPKHTILGLAVFVAVMILSASLDRLLQFLMPLRRQVSSAGIPITQRAGNRSGASAKSDPRGLIKLGVVGGIVFVALTFGFVRPVGQVVAQGVIPDGGLVPDLSTIDIPAEAGPWKMSEHRRIERDPSDAFGLVSETWRYQSGDNSLLISLDGPYDGWHDLGYCYGAIGWQLRDVRNVDLATVAGDRSVVCVEMNLYRGEGRRNLVMFTSFDSLGRTVQPPAAHGSFFRNLLNRLGATDSSKTQDGEEVVAPVYQVQLVLESDSELTPEQRATIDRLYDFASRQLRGVFVARGEGKR